MAAQTNFSSDYSFFAFLNANHSKTAHILLNRDISEKKFDMVFINEPYFTSYGISYFEKKLWYYFV